VGWIAAPSCLEARYRRQRREQFVLVRTPDLNGPLESRYPGAQATADDLLGSMVAFGQVRTSGGVLPNSAPKGRVSSCGS
jgi:hypothetical protein